MNDPFDPNAQAQSGTSSDPAAQVPATPTSGTPVPPTNSTSVPTPPPQGGSNLSGIMDENVDVSNLVANAGQNQQDSAFLLQIPIPAHPNTTFDEKKFVELLAGSISLTVNEKRKIIEAIPQLSQFQIDELIKIFEEEKGKFAELEQKHAEQIAELEKQHAADSPELLQLQQEEASKRAAEEEEAERLKQALGLAEETPSSSTFQLLFFVNGQEYGRAEVASHITAEEALATAKANPTIAQILQTYPLLEEKYVPGQSVDFIVQV